MHLTLALTVAFSVLSSLVASAQIPRPDPRNDLNVKRNNVALCKNVLIALKASAFCSSFVPITATTSTVTQTGARTRTTITVTLPCTSVKRRRGLSTTPAAPTTTRTTTRTTTSATPKAISTTPAAPSTTPRVSTTKTTTKTTTASTSTSQCKIWGVPPNVGNFACNVIREACIEFVKPKTVTVTTFLPGDIITNYEYVTPTCPPTTTTTPSTTPSTTPTTTPTTTPSTTTSSAPPTQSSACNQEQINYCRRETVCDCFIGLDGRTAFCAAGEQCPVQNSQPVECSSDAQCPGGKCVQLGNLFNGACNNGCIIFSAFITCPSTPVPF